MYDTSIFNKMTFKNVFTLLSFLLILNTILTAQTSVSTEPIFEITKVQDGSENGSEIVYTVNMTDTAGNNIINTLDNDIVLDIEFGVDSDVEQSDIATAYPKVVRIRPGVGSTVIRLRAIQDDITETQESLVAMIYNPSKGTISETRSYATATLSDYDVKYVVNGDGSSKSTINADRKNSVIGMFLN